MAERRRKGLRLKSSFNTPSSSKTCSSSGGTAGSESRETDPFSAFQIWQPLSLWRKVERSAERPANASVCQHLRRTLIFPGSSGDHHIANVTARLVSCDMLVTRGESVQSNSLD